MVIPKSFTVGVTPYTVKVVPTLGGCWGRAWLGTGVIKIAATYKKKKRRLNGQGGQHATFWHEATHAILYDMGNPLFRDEAFVTAFANKLNQIIETAKL